MTCIFKLIRYFKIYTIFVDIFKIKYFNIQLNRVAMSCNLLIIKLPEIERNDLTYLKQTTGNQRVSYLLKNNRRN